jgi:hypothetical protein
MGGQGMINGPQRLAIAWLTRFPPPLRRTGRRLGLLILGHFTVFLLALGHDEFVATCVEADVIPVHRAEVVELIFGAALFLFWSALTIAMVRLIERSRVDMQD